MKLENDNYCFACGRENPIGLKMNFEFGEGTVTVRYRIQKEHQGWANVAHGGILFTLMDEAMAWMIIQGGDNVVTSHIDIRFLRPASVGEEITIKGKIEKKEGNLVHASSQITGAEGKILASCSGTYFRI